MIAANLSGLYQRESHSTCSSIIATQGPGTNSWAKSLLMSTSLREIGPQISWKKPVQIPVKRRVKWQLKVGNVVVRNGRKRGEQQRALVEI